MWWWAFTVPNSQICTGLCFGISVDFPSLLIGDLFIDDFEQGFKAQLSTPNPDS